MYVVINLGKWVKYAEKKLSKCSFIDRWATLIVAS